ncbi:alpha/beta hydrolase [Prosthecochloris sp. GSB1]|uniref:alpha/beta fold hydrolase n=1 Tax=Prosthecochloris sp. GSB1 TaxID=281093 RepID=UPI000B8C9E7B|nr:alpha/beta hydrolase [Prosthecochloris sp. GSB1]ASQ90755.1 alpha/beta hydrolase [Prosthecochloris sp. GSB1]
MKQSRQTGQTEKFLAYSEKLRKLSAGGTTAEIRRAGYETGLMACSRFAELNGVVHHYHDSGPADARETVILIHGWDCWWMWWHHIIRRLNASGIRTIAYDLKGHGWSDNDPLNDYSKRSFPEDLHKLVEFLGLERFHVSAFSFGPLVALYYAKKHPGKIRSMVLFNFGYLENNAFIERFAPATINFAFNNLLRKIRWWLPAYMFARLVLSKNTVLFHDVQIGFESLGFCAPEAIEQTTAQITSLAVTNAVPELVERADMPILFVAGDGDPIMTSENTRRLAGYSRKGKFVNVPDCGHLITLELPETAGMLVLDHVLGNAASAS